MLIASSCSKPKPAENIMFISASMENFDLIKSKLKSAGLDMAQFPNTVANSSNLAVQQGYLLTGQHPLYSGAFDNEMPLNLNKSPMISSLLKEQGYTSYFAGEWYLQDDINQKGFDISIKNLQDLSLKGNKSFIYLSNPDREEVNAISHILNQVKDDCFVVLSSFTDSEESHQTKLVLAGSELRLDYSESDMLVSQMNVMPTALGLLGLPVPKNIGKRDISRIIRWNKEEAIKSVPLFYHGKKGYWGAATKSESYIEFADSTLGAISQPKNLSSLDEMKELSHVWMNYFGDEHFGYDSLVQVMPIQEWLNQEEPVVPIDELKKLHGKTIMNFHGNLTYD